MALFRSSNRNVFQPTAYGYSHRRRRVPRWLVLILTGIVLGAGGVLFLQKSYGPQRLTIEQSQLLQNDLNSANLDKQRLQAQLDARTDDVANSKATVSTLESKLQQSQKQIPKLKSDLELLIQAIPADPRGTNPGIRAITLTNANGELDYKILVMQNKEGNPTFAGQMQLRISGYYPSGKVATIETDPTNISVDYYNQIQGSAPLPESFTPRHVTVLITDPDTKKLVASRTERVARQ